MNRMDFNKQLQVAGITTIKSPQGYQVSLISQQNFTPIRIQVRLPTKLSLRCLKRTICHSHLILVMPVDRHGKWPPGPVGCGP